MGQDDGFEASVREYLAGAERALARGDAAAAAAEIVQALQYCFAIVHELTDSDPERYGKAWENLANELSKLPPTLIRHAVRIIDRRTGPP
jgi:hypothetical protein